MLRTEGDALMLPEDAIVVEDQTLARELAELRELKAQMVASRRAFFERLRACEERGRWRALAPTFALFLKKTELCTHVEYVEACRTLAILPAETIDTIGMTAAAKVIELPEETRPAAIDELKKEAARFGPLSEDKARRVVRRHMPPPKRVEELKATPAQARREPPPLPSRGPKPSAGSSVPPPGPPPEELVLRVPSREPSAIAAALVQRLGDDVCRALILALDAKVNRVRGGR